MSFLARRFRKAGYDTLIITYPSRKLSIPHIAAHVAPQIVSFSTKHNQVHFIGHSLGGIIIRAVLATYEIENKGRIVMLGTPHRGSEIVDRLKNNFLFRAFFGPAGCSLTSDQKFDESLGPVKTELGIIAGDLHAGFMSRLWRMAQPNDGKVSVASSHAHDEADHITLHVGHTVMPFLPSVIAQARCFIQTGKFMR